MRRHVSLEEALQGLTEQSSQFAEHLKHEAFTVEIYAPVGQDHQTPHTRDEVYVISRGSGWFFNGTERHPFTAGDVIYVPKGVVHRFEDFSEDFVTWVIFFGTE